MLARRYEYYSNAENSWKRTYGLEHWCVADGLQLRGRALLLQALTLRCSTIAYRTFNTEGLMQKRHCSANEIAISEEERWFKEGVDPDSLVISDMDG